MIRRLLHAVDQAVTWRFVAAWSAAWAAAALLIDALT